MTWPPTGSVGLTITALAPSGDVHVDGSVYPARVAGGTRIDQGRRIVVAGFDPFGLLVRELAPSDVAPVQAVPTLEDLILGEERRKAASGSGASLHASAQTPGGSGWRPVRVGLGMIFWGTILAVVSGG